MEKDRSFLKNRDGSIADVVCVVHGKNNHCIDDWGSDLLADWYYIGHYGQLGPLTRDQMDELILGGVVARDTYVWQSGMADWLYADRVPELGLIFQQADPFVAPPPPPSAPKPPPMRPPGSDLGYAHPGLSPYDRHHLVYDQPRSDRSRVMGGLLNILIPGVGRMYLGYAAYGALQLITAACFVGWVWSVVDGIIILCGGLRLDGYGRKLTDQ